MDGKKITKEKGKQRVRYDIKRKRVRKNERNTPFLKLKD